MLFSLCIVALSYTVAAVFQLAGPKDPDLTRWADFLPRYLHDGVRRFFAEHQGKPGSFWAPNIHGEFVFFYSSTDKWPLGSYSHRSKTSDYACEILHVNSEMIIGDKSVKMTTIIESYWAYPTTDVQIPTGILRSYTFRCRLSATKIFNIFYPGIISPKKADAYAKSSKFMKLDKDFNDHETLRARNHETWTASCPMVGQILNIRNSKAYCENPGNLNLVSDAMIARPGAGEMLASTNSAGTSHGFRQEAVTSPMLTLFLSAPETGSIARN